MVPRPKNYPSPIYETHEGFHSRGGCSSNSRKTSIKIISKRSRDEEENHGKNSTRTTRLSLLKKVGKRGLSVAYLGFLILKLGAVCNFIHIHMNIETGTGTTHQLLSFEESMLASKQAFAPTSSSSRNPPSPKLPEVSACLIVMDDNHYLIEWLAYHYHTANLRHLIVASDPHSRTSPTKVLDRWRDKISIQEWNESNYLPPDFDRQVEENSSYGDKTKKVLSNHRVRQAQFNLECLREFKRQNRGWTVILDTDEYLNPKPLAKDSETLADTKNDTNQKQPTPTVPEILGSFRIPLGFESVYSPCIPMNREQYSARESPNIDVQSMVAPGFDGRDFQTLRWRKHGFETEWKKLSIGDDQECGIVRHIPNKVIIDLSRITKEEISKEQHSGNPHKPLSMCPENVYSHKLQTPFVVHHYMGTPEQWFYRSNDKRGIGYRRARYEDMNERFGIRESDTIRPWLQSFVDAVGSAEASRLLEGVGKLEVLPGEKGTKLETMDSNATKDAKFKVGDIVEVNFAGEGVWDKAQIYAAHSDNYYSVFFEDCTQEIATFAERIRPFESSKSEDNNSQSSEE